MPLDPATLEKDLRALQTRLAKDLVERADRTEVASALREEHAERVKRRETGEAYELWRRHFAEQAASAWVLSVLFVRVLEDRGLLARPRIAGERAREGREGLAFLAPHVGAREYLLLVFEELRAIPAARSLFDPAHNLVWRLGPSEAGAKALLEVFDARDAKDPDRPRLAFGPADADGTRYLGDIYERLDPDAKKRFALLQTPDFVERFILDRTLTPALDEWRASGFRPRASRTTARLGDVVPEACSLKPEAHDAPVRVIDPTCGSGHFLLGAFARLFAAWQQAAPGAGARAWAERALAGVAGIDVNPVAVAIARFRLVLAALEAAGVTSLEGAPVFTPAVAVGDTLLWGGDKGEAKQLLMEDDAGGWSETSLFHVESRSEARAILERRYDVVVGNPPYITPKDDTLNDRYRERYSTCHRSYSLAVPFTQRFFELAVPGGRVGMINANSFMKREFGTKLIKEFLPRVDLQAVYDTSGAFIPGHGTPTVILVGRQRAPASDSVRIAMGKRGELGKPADPAKGEVWSSIEAHGDEVGFENGFISVAEVARATLAKHPWSLGGGGAAELKAKIEGVAQKRISACIESIGFFFMTHADEAFFLPVRALTRLGVPEESFRSAVSGEDVRDWTRAVRDSCVFPYDTSLQRWAQVPYRAEWAWFWSLRELLWARATFGSSTYKREGRPWFDFHQFPVNRARVPLSITFAEVATHNHFVLDRGGKVFKQTAPVIKLPADVGEDAHIELLGFLNSSTIGFWMKQVFHNKGGEGHQSGIKAEMWERFFQNDATKLKSLPLAPTPAALLPLTRALDTLGQEAGKPLLDYLPTATAASADTLRAWIADRVATRRRGLAKLRGLQEELDWLVYEAYGLIPEGEGRVASPAETAPLTLGHRPFEIVLAREVAEGELTTAWFERHGSTAAQTTEVPARGGDGAPYPEAWRERVEHRLSVIARVSEVALIERPEYKRRWSKDDLDERVRDEVRERLLDRIEEAVRREPTATSVRALAHALARAPLARALADVLHGGHAPAGPQVLVEPLVSLEPLLAALLEEESVPAQAACRYTETGLEKRAVWERVWDLQRAEDRGQKGLEIPVPPKYANTDFQGGAWSHRGKLDVPKERFISYPGAAAADDPTPVYGWAGWTHLERAQATAALHEARKLDGAGKDVRVPLLAALLEVLPWVEQWHDPEAKAKGDDPPGEAFAAWLEQEMAALGVTKDELRAWRPPTRSAARAAAKAAGAARKAKREADADEGEGGEDGGGDESVSGDGGSSAEAAPKPRRARKAAGDAAAAATVDPERLLAAIAAAGAGGAGPAALAEALGAPEKAVRTAAEGLVEAGRLKLVKKRPVLYGATGGA